MADLILQVFLPLYTACLIVALLVHRFRISRQIGRNPIVIRPFGNRELPHQHLELVLLMCAIVAVADVLLNAVAGGWVSEHIAVPAMRESSVARWTGFAALTAGLLLSAVAIRHMGESWRMGIDTEGPGALASRGLYAHVRHPIYSGMLLTTAGLAVTIGDVFSIAVAVAAWVGLPIQARLEEQFLLSVHGEAYRQYLRRTGRFWPTTRR